MSERKMTADIVISGSGVMGLMMAEQLSRYEIPAFGKPEILVIEKTRKLASGASVKNEGWLHAGSYHAYAIDDPIEAQAVVERTRFGHDKILEIAPQAVEDSAAKTFALVHDRNTADVAVERWLEFDIPFREVTVRELEERIPNLNLPYVAAGFEVEDRSINTRTLYQTLQKICRERGVRFRTNMYIGQFNDDKNAEVFSTETEEKIADLAAVSYIHTAGYGMQSIIDLLGLPNRMRFWKSHLAVASPMTEDNVFLLEDGEAGAMYHMASGGKPRSVVGINKDTGGYLDLPDFVIDRTKISLINGAMGRLFNNWNPSLGFDTYACVKTDLGIENSIQNLSPQILTPLPNHMLLLPGKMTEAPYVAVTQARLIIASIGAYIISSRPYNLDTVREAEGDADDISERPLDMVNFL